jgi:hypothetical protein
MKRWVGMIAIALLLAGTTALAWLVGRQECEPYREKAQRLDTYCRRVQLSLQSARSDLADERYREGTAQHLNAQIEARLSFDGIIQCSLQPFDLQRYRGCLAGRDYPCLIDVVGRAESAISQSLQE